MFDNKPQEATMLLFCRICYPTALSIRICDLKFIPINQKNRKLRQITNQPAH